MGLIDRLVGAVFESVESDDAFAALAYSLANELGTVSAQLQIHGPSGARNETVYGIEDSLISAYKAYFWQKDEWAIGYQARGLSAIASSESVVDSASFLNSELYCDLLRPNGDFFWCLGFVSDLGAGERLLFGAHRQRRQAAFDQDLLTEVQGLKPFLTHLILARHRAAEGRGRLAERVLDGEPDAVFVVSRDARIMYRNVAGAKLLAVGGLLCGFGDRLSARDPRSAATLLRALSWACTGRGGQVLRLGPDSPPMAVEVDLIPGSGGLLASVRVRNEEARLLAAVARATGAFGLTKAEARVAEALLRGLSVTDYAQRQGLGLPTVRAQVRALLAKTGVRRQAALILALREGV